MFGVRNENRVFEAAWEVVTRRIFDRAMAATDLAERTLRSEGDLRRVDDELWAGNCALSKDRQILPRLSRASALGFAIYAGNRRITAATVLDAGTAPDIGEFAPAPLADSVLRRGEVFRGKVEYDGRQYISVGRPVFSEGGANYAPIGMIEAFQDEAAIFDLLSASARRMAETEKTDVENQADGMESLIAFIDNVSRKLQLLALNGNIIAAQAGRQGGAFRVVCTELGDLADRAKVQTARVRKLVQSLGLDQERAPDPGYGRQGLAPGESPPGLEFVPGYEAASSREDGSAPDPGQDDLHAGANSASQSPANDEPPPDSSSNLG